MLTPQVTTIIYHHTKKLLLKIKEKIKKKYKRICEDYTKTHMLTKTVYM